MPLSDLRELLIDDLREIQHAEKALHGAFPDLAAAAADEDLRESFDDQATAARTHLTRLETIFDLLAARPGGRPSDPMTAMIDAAVTVPERMAAAGMRDSAAIASARKIHHYLVAAYQTVVDYAQLLEEKETADLLQRTLTEEERTLQNLMAIAESGVNDRALALAEESARKSKPAK